MMLLSYGEKTPNLHESVFVASGVKIIGEVTAGKDSNIWYNSVLRGDVAPITIGEEVNIQDGTVIHTSRFNGGCTIGNRVTIGHICLLHACSLHDDSFIGMGSVIMDKVVVETFGFVAAGSLVTPGKIIKSGELWAGSPAKFVRKITDQETFLIKDTPTHYIKLANLHKSSNPAVNITMMGR
ncbi:MAG: gamma carbonic anhydrase family protein [Rickettsiaceae bacterium]|nr:gamma carbonic anhydrase family protein [Rickettsiaceae bacterium]